MPKQVETARMEGLRKRRPWKRWTNEIRDDLNMVGIRNCHTVAREQKEWRRILLIHKEVQCLGKKEEEG
jgi:hypothetical protein